MIFVTVGAQMPFDRLVRTVDAWAERTGRDDVFAQIGRTAYQPRRMQWTRFLDPESFRRTVFDCEYVIAHAGMGTIITAMELGRPIIVMPRRGAMRETRNDHQVSTAARFAQLANVNAAFDERELATRLEDLPDAAAPGRVGSHASFELLSALRRFIEGNTEHAPLEIEVSPGAVPQPTARKLAA